LLNFGQVAFPSCRDVFLGLQHRFEVEDDGPLEVLGLPDVEKLDLLLDESRNPVEIFLGHVLKQLIRVEGV